MRTPVVLVFAMGLLTSAGPVSAYKESTHEKISQESDMNGQDYSFKDARGYYTTG